MFTTSILKTARLFAVCLSLSSVAMMANASGSFNPYGGNSEQRIYGIGKQVFHKKLVCDSCPLSGQSINKNVAHETIKNISARADGFETLKPKERKAAIFYLKKRYRLR